MAIDVVQAPVTAHYFNSQSGIIVDITDTLSVTYPGVTGGSSVLIFVTGQCQSAGEEFQAPVPGDINAVIIQDAHGNFVPCDFVGGWGEDGADGIRGHYPGNSLIQVYAAFRVPAGDLTIGFKSRTFNTVTGVSYWKSVVAYEMTSDFNSATQVSIGDIAGVGGHLITINDSKGTAITSSSGADTFNHFQWQFMVLDIKSNGQDFFIAVYLGPTVSSLPGINDPPTITPPYAYGAKTTVDGLLDELNIYLPKLPIIIPTPPILLGGWQVKES